MSVDGLPDFDDVDFDGIAHELDDGRALVESGNAALPEIRNLEPPQPYIDPLYAEFGRLREAARRAGVDDEFYHLVEAQLMRARQINAEVERVGNPASATGKRLGGSAALTSRTEIVQESVLRWQGTDAETGPVTITAGVVTPTTVATLVVRPFLYVHWGTYGENFVAEVDIGTGRQFSFNASMVEVAVALDALSAANAREVRLAANLSFRPMVRTSPLIRTRYVDSQATGAGNAVNLVVPPFAVGILPVQMSDTVGVVTLDFIDSSGTVRYSLSVVNGSQVASIPLTSDIVRVQVTTTSATTQHVRVPFELSI